VSHPRRGRILLLVDNRARDAHGILLIYYWLKQMGCRVVLANKRNWLRKFHAWNPSVVVVSYTDGLSQTLETVARTARVAVIPQEGAIPVKSPIFFDRYTGNSDGRGAFTKGVARIFVWGPTTARWLCEEGIYEPNQVVVSGTPRLDPYRIARPIEVPPNRALGFAMSLQKINSYKRENVIDVVEFRRKDQVNQYYDEGRNIEDFLWADAATLRAALDVLEAYVLRVDSPVNIRPNPFEFVPGYNILRRRYPNLSVGNESPPWKWLEQIHSLVTINSSTGVEALLLGKPVISVIRLVGDRLFDHINLPTTVKPRFLDFYYQPKSVSEAVDLLSAAHAGHLSPVIDRTGFDAYLKEFYDWPRVEPSSLTIAREIATLAEVDAGKAIRRPIHPISHLRTLRTNVMNLIVDLSSGEFRPHQRYHFYRWHLKDFTEAQRIWNLLNRSTEETPSLPRSL